MNRSPANVVPYPYVWFQLHVVLALYQLQFPKNYFWWLVLKIVIHQLVVQPVHWVTSPRLHMPLLPRPMPTWHPICGKIYHLVEHHTKNMLISWHKPTNQAAVSDRNHKWKRKLKWFLPLHFLKCKHLNI